MDLVMLMSLIRAREVGELAPILTVRDGYRSRLFVNLQRSGISVRGTVKKVMDLTRIRNIMKMVRNKYETYKNFQFLNIHRN